MVSNYKETAVKTVNVDVGRLKVTLQKNLETHKKEYKEAMEGYRDARQNAIQRVAEAATAAVANNTQETRKALHEAYSAFSRLERPQDHSSSYEQAIALMDWETNKTIELSINDFECYVRDSWDWQRSFKNIYANYSASQ